MEKHEYVEKFREMREKQDEISRLQKRVDDLKGELISGESADLLFNEVSIMFND